MANICLMFFFFYSIYSIIGVSLFGGALRTICATPEVVAACVPTGAAEKTNMLLWGGKKCDVVTCPGSLSYCSAPKSCMIVGDNTRGGLAGYDNVVQAWVSLFIATTGDNWQDITWTYVWSPAFAAPIAYPFMISIQVCGCATAAGAGGADSLRRRRSFALWSP